MLPVSAYLFGLATIFITLIGGRIALKFKKFINPLIAFCGGTLIALALLDLIPESLELLEGIEPHRVLTYVLIAFVGTHLLDKVVSFHSHSHSEDCPEHKQESKGIAAVSGLGLHSFLDGLIIGTGFLVDSSTGVLVSLVVLLHRLADGLNSVTLSLRSNHKDKTTGILLVLNSVSPIFGVILSGFLNLSGITLGYILCIFAGFFLYIGATDLLPEAHKERSSVGLVFFTILGASLVGIIGLFLH